MVPFYLAGLAILTSLGLAGIFARIHWSPPLIVDTSSAMLIYGIYFGIFKKFCWKWKWLRSIDVVSTPILEGTWTGTVQTSFPLEAPTQDVNVTIGQDWTHILIRLHGPTSGSRSLSGSMTVTTGECTVTYEYLNEPNVDAVETMQIHYGTASLMLTGEDKLEGHYYSGRGRQNVGSLKLRRIAPANSHSPGH